MKSPNGSPRFVELFAGIGGFRIALESQDMKCVWANDIDAAACKVYRSKWKDGTLHEGDINEVDLMTPEERSSFLSPAYSKKSDPVVSYLKTSKESSPTTLVKLSSQSSTRWMNWGTMSNGVCLTLDISESLKTGSECTLQDILESNIPWRDPLPAELDNAKSRSNGGPHRPIRDLDDVQKALTVQDAYRLLIGSSRAGKVKVRRHTITECERLQGFPDGWTAAVDAKSGFKLLGNAVTTHVVAFVGESIRKHLAKKTNSNTNDT